MVERVRMMSSQPGARRSDEELKAIYDDRYAAEYDPHAVPRIERMRPFFELSRQDVVADFGCGNGVLLEVIGPSVRQYLGVDFSDAFVRAAEQRRDARGASNGTFYCADIVDFCRERPNQLDAGFALDFSEHIYDDQFVRIFTAVHGALKPGAPLYLHTPNREYFMERFRERGVLKQIDGHVGVRDARQHRELLARCGFSSVEVRYLPHYLYPASAFHWLGRLPLVGRMFRARLFLTCRREGGA
jgi:SAM-dependent methyltransferase